ncbi:hypothetical protein JZ751_028883 [Albula glossodonta]|uniref:Uncharacterized protein n=1 Tax=Albula glossodonta TaxID=121402 RepID=A0A8T2NAG2_9TELE|nr:hypothetical protein JZ751_028883 [Albula glossodonta]
MAIQARKRRPKGKKDKAAHHRRPATIPVVSLYIKERAYGCHGMSWHVEMMSVLSAVHCCDREAGERWGIERERERKSRANSEP